VKRVNFAKKMIDLLFISLKITKCLLNSTLFISEVICKHVVKMSVMLTLCFNLEEVKIINKSNNEKDHLFDTVLQ